jgi:hypothetical protein
MYCKNDEMSEEHYPARCVGNEDIVAFDIMKMFDSFQSKEIYNKILKESADGENLNDISSNIFDTILSKPLYPEGRTARTLCRKCNTFLGKYDEAYLKFFSFSGEPKCINGFTNSTKIQIIKSIFGKFLSLPEAQNEEFDFIDFIKDESLIKYYGKWRLYFVRRDSSSDLMGFKDIGTGKLLFDKDVVYELSDDKFIFNLMNFEKHSCYPMTNIFDIFNNNYNLVEGVGEYGGYHAQILMTRFFENFDKGNE